MPSAHLLVVEDESKLAYSLERGLTEAGFNVALASSAEIAHRALKGSRYDLMVLDLRLPGQDGLDFLRDLRQAGVAIPVLILTARDSMDEMVNGLDTGGDDYLTKPFAFAELLARIRALLRRHISTNGKTVEVADIKIDTFRRQATQRGRPLDLSPKELVVLEYLIQHAGLVVTRDMIGEAVWGKDYNSLSNIVEVFINRLRQKMEFVNESPLIVTIRGAGYMLRAISPARTNSIN
jgi:DNA-binding response OmpR family regulator